jgi:two-component system, NarL family, sensor histidine kinase DesK
MQDGEVSMSIAVGTRNRPGPGSGGPLRWFFSAVWLVYLIQPVSELFGHQHTALWTIGGLAITVTFCVVYVGVIGAWDSNPRMAQRGLAVIFALAVLACVVYGSDWLPMWIYVSAATGFVIPGWRPAMLAVLGVGGCYALLSWLTHFSVDDFLIDLLPVVLIGWAMCGFRTQIMLTRELGQARETVAKLAANEERLRLARDMHDLTGQSLSLVTLKAELARKMLGRLPQTSERDAAMSEVDDIGRVSRQTLQDIREAVSGYRRPTLAIEIITARTALEAAAIRLDDDPAVTLRSGTFDPDAEAALAWCLREAVTNVIRHSGAKSCRVRLTQQAGEISLEVSDTGRGFGGRTAPARDNAAAPRPGDGGAQSRPASRVSRTPLLAGQEPGPAGEEPGPAGEEPGPASQESGPAGQQPGPAQAAGSGLRGMSERLAAIGGRLSFGPAAGAAGAGGRGFRLVATVPETPALPPDEEARRTDEGEHGETPPPGSAAAGPPNGTGHEGHEGQHAGQHRSTAARPE